MSYDQDQSSRIAQRTWVETVGIRLIADAGSLPEAPFDGQLIYRVDENKIYIYDGDAWIAPVQ